CGGGGVHGATPSASGTACSRGQSRTSRGTGRAPLEPSTRPQPLSASGPPKRNARPPPKDRTRPGPGPSPPEPRPARGRRLRAPGPCTERRLPSITSTFRRRDAMSWVTVKEALRGKPGDRVTVKGWVRTKRDSKADGGLSFITVHDGTCFDAIQVVARAALPNYDSEIARLTTGCAVEADGVL